jgi:ubiquinone/menaquinone biosynthesis C-methylase UbiE
MMTLELGLTLQEQLVAIVYGDTFALYDEKSFDEFVEPLYMRLNANGINPDVFKGKRCLDAGCGGGRGSILMAQSGAKEVIGVDLSDKNVESCRKWGKQKGFTNLSFQQASLMGIPFEDESFDVVWCNGVLHHTSHPDEGLKEITRVLKTGGQLWLYLYGSGGIYWYMVDWVRDTLKGVDVRECIYQLRLMEMPIRRIAEWIDDWFVPHLRRYTMADVTHRLEELGYENTDALKYGVGYDTSHRRVGVSGAELALMGEGDLRHFCRKASSPRGNHFALPDPPDGKGSRYTDDTTVTQFQGPLDRIAEGLRRLQAHRGDDIDVFKILTCRSVHSRVRSLLEDKGPINTAALHQQLAGLDSILERLAG